MFSAIGFGDVIATTVIDSILTAILTIPTIFVVALVTGVVVVFCNDVVSTQYKASKAEVLNKPENPDKLIKEELKALSVKINNIL